MTASIAPVVRATDTVVALTQAPVAELTLPANVTIPAGSSRRRSMSSPHRPPPTALTPSQDTLPAGLTTLAPTAVGLTVADLTIALTPNPMNLNPSEVGVMTATIPAAYAAPITVTTLSAAPGVFTVAGTATIAAGVTTTTFNVTALATTGGPNNVEAYLPTPQYSLVNPGPDATAAVNVTNLPLTLTPASTTIMAGGKQTYTLSVPVAQATPTIVTLTSSSGAVSVPASVTIPASTTSVTFDAIGETTVGSPSTVTATLPAALGGLNAVSTATVVPLTVSTNPSNLSTVAAVDRDITVTIGTTAAKIITLTLTTSVPTVAGLVDMALPPAGTNTVVIPIGSNTGQFRIRGVGPGNATVGVNAPAALNPAATPHAPISVTVQAIQIQIAPTTLGIAQGAYGLLTASLTNVPGGVAVPVTVNLLSAAGSTVGVDDNMNPVPVPAATASIVIPIASSSQVFYAYGNNVGGPIQITATLPLAVGGGSAVANVGVYPGAPTITSVTPNTATANGVSPTVVTIMGTNFNGYTGVTFGGVAEPSCLYINDTQVSCAAIPAHVAAVTNVQVNTATGSALSAFTYTATLTLSLVTSTNTPTGSFVTAPGINCIEPTVGICSAVQTSSPVTITPTIQGADTTWTWGGSCGGGTCTNGAACSVTMNIDPRLCTVTFN